MISARISQQDARLKVEENLRQILVSEIPMSHADAHGRETSAPQGLCIQRLLEVWAERTPDTVAIVAPGRTPLTYGRLRRHIDAVVHAFHAMGVGRHDRVAIVLPQGPEMATAFLAVAASATSAPLNPAYRANEFDFYLADLHAKALLIQSGMDSPARAVAQARGIPIIELVPVLEAEAGIFTLSGAELAPAVRDGFAQPGDVALVLHTSGTTSRPKSVPLTHTNICTSARHIATALALAESDRCLNIMPLFHIHGLIAGTLASLAAGASVVCSPGFYASQFFAWLDEFCPTWYTAVPTMHQAILARATVNRTSLAHCALRFIRSSSAPLPPQVLAALERVFRVPVIEAYGMTEAAHQITSNPLPPRRRKVGSVGVAAGPEVAILDEAGNVLPAGVKGEIAIQGANVTPGYENNPEVNECTFAHGWFRTGDAGFLDTDGYLFITGRLKEIINRGGEKIAPQEVEEALMEHPAVAQAVTFAVPDARLGEEVAAAVVLREHAQATERDIRQFAATRLTDFKVPRHVLIVEDLPKGPTGKLQRLGLAEKWGLGASNQEASETQEAFMAPRLPMEARLAELWSHILGVPRVGIHDNFFALGGDSILAAQTISRLREAMHVELSLLAFFETPTIAGIVRSLETSSQRVPALPGPARQPLPKDKELPLSYAQQQLWFLEQLEPGNPVYNRPAFFRLTGRLDVAALEQSLNEIVQRHEILRTTFSSLDGRPFQRISPCQSLHLPVVDLSGLSRTALEAEARRLAAEEAQQPFDLAHGPLLRATLLWLGDEEHLLLLTLHHIVFDGWSQGVLLQELTALYAAFSQGRLSALPELPIQYADFAVWQCKRLTGELLERQLAYWQRQLDGLAPLQLPTDRPRPAVMSFRGARGSLSLSPSLTKALRALSERADVTLFMTLLAAFQTLLHRYTSQEDITIGSPVANRNWTEVEGLLGCFVNTLVLRTDLSGDPTFRELLARVREVCLGAYTHQELPFAKLVEELAPKRSLSHTPLLQAMFILQNVPMQCSELPGLQLTLSGMDTGTAKFDLTAEVIEEGEGLSCVFEYSTDLFDAATIGRMLEHFHTLLKGIVADPTQRLSALPLLTQAEQYQFLVEWNNTEVDQCQELCIHQLFEAQVARTPDAIAAVFEGQQLTYRALNARSNQLAHFLRKQGVGPEVLVGICMERSLDMLVGLLGVLKAGGAYVPLDPSYPKARLAYVLQDTQVSGLLTQARLLDRLPRDAGEIVCLEHHRHLFESEDNTDPEMRTTPEHLAYVFHTSGSTGAPKGVLSHHRGVVNYLSYLVKNYGISRTDVVLQLAPFSFDASVRDLIGPLTAGAQVVLVKSDDAKDPAVLLAKIRAHRVTCLLSIVPTMLHGLIDAVCAQEGPYDTLRLILVSGEALPLSICRQVNAAFGQYIVVVNQYGPTECTMTSTYHSVQDLEDPQDVTLIGRSIPHARLYVLDRNCRLVPVGVPGELYISGAGLARGYLNHPGLTAEKFIPHPFSAEPGARLYKTGDLARYLPDGHLEFLGRLDHQVKIRGFRVELGEIETVLGQHPAVRQTVVLAREDTPGVKRLVAYVVTNQKQEPSISQFRHFLQAKLPEYMVPAVFVLLDTLPLTPNGKIDRRALPAPDHTRPELEGAFVAPRTPVEEALTRIWAEVLKLEHVGVHDNFFELGGHSLLATQVISRLRRTFPRVEMPLHSLFETPTVAELALAIVQHQAGQAEPVGVDHLIAEVEELSAHEVQQRLADESALGR